MNQAFKSRPRLVLLVRISYSGPCFFDILQTVRPASKIKQQGKITGVWALSRGNTLGKQHERAGKGGKIFTVYKKEKFPKKSKPLL